MKHLRNKSTNIISRHLHQLPCQTGFLAPHHTPFRDTDQASIWPKLYQQFQQFSKNIQNWTRGAKGTEKMSFLL